MSRAPQQEGRRAIEFVGGPTFELERATMIRSDIPTAFAIERMQNGKWRMTYNGILIPDFTKIERINIIRED